MKLRDRPYLALAGAFGLLCALYAGFYEIAGFPLTQATINWAQQELKPCFAFGCSLPGPLSRGGVRGARKRQLFSATALAGAAFNWQRCALAAPRRTDRNGSRNWRNWNNILIN